MILYGAGGHAKVILSIINACGENVEGIFDDDFQKKSLLGLPVTNPYSKDKFVQEKLILAIGDNMVRRSISGKIAHKFGNALHPSALLAVDVRLGFGIAVMHNAVIQTGSVIGNHSIINTSSVIDHDCTIGNFVHVAPGVVLCGMVSIGENTLIGAGSIIIPNVRIGKNCIIGAGSVIIADVPDYAVVCGNPGKIIKL